MASSFRNFHRMLEVRSTSPLFYLTRVGPAFFFFFFFQRIPVQAQSFPFALRSQLCPFSSFVSRGLRLCFLIIRPALRPPSSVEVSPFFFLFLKAKDGFFLWAAWGIEPRDLSSLVACRQVKAPLFSFSFFFHPRSVERLLPFPPPLREVRAYTRLYLHFLLPPLCFFLSLSFFSFYV